MVTMGMAWYMKYIVVPTQVDKNTNINHCAVPFLSRAAVNLSWYDTTMYVHCTLYAYCACTLYSVQCTVGTV